MNFRKIILVPLPPFFLITNCRLLFSSFQEGMMTKLSMKLPWHKILRIHIFRKSGTVRKGSKTLFYRLHLFNSCSLSCVYRSKMLSFLTTTSKSFSWALIRVAPKNNKMQSVFIFLPFFDLSSCTSTPLQWFPFIL